jgi:hypothetical protein
MLAFANYTHTLQPIANGLDIIKEMCQAIEEGADIIITYMKDSTLGEVFNISVH